MDADSRRTQLLALQQQCDLLEVQMEQIRTQLSETKAQMSPLAPVYTLPDELMLMCLRMAFQHDFPYCRHSEKWPRDSPFAISQVSRRWRTVALSEPTIWSCIHLTGSTPSGKHGKNLLGLYLARSKELPLSVTLSWPWASPESSAAVRTDMLEKWTRVGQHSDRWSRISLICPELKDMQEILQHTPPRQFFQLKCVCMTSLRPQWPWSGDGIGFSGVPTFKQFWVDNVRVYEEENSTPGMFAQLTELKITRCYNMKLHTLLELLTVHTPSLATFICGDVRLTEDDSALPLPTSLPPLKHLALYRAGVFRFGLRDDPLSAFLYNGAAASLETLHIGMEHMSARVFLALQREETFLPAVRTLQLLHYPYDPMANKLSTWNYATDTHYGMDVDVLTNIARNKLPSVETFETSIPATQFLRSLMSGPDETRETTANDAILWPALHALSLCEVEEPTLLEFLEHRARVQRPIRTILLSPKLRAQLSADAFELFSTLGIYSAASYRPTYTADSIEVAGIKYQ